MTRRWWTAWLGVPIGVSSSFLTFVAVAGTTSASTSVAGRAFAGVLGAILAPVAVRSFVVGLVVEADGVAVRGLWRSRRIAAADVAGLVMESSAGGRWLMPSVLTIDGAFVRARWAGRPARRRTAAGTAGELAWALQRTGGSAGGVATQLDRRGVEIRGSAARVHEYRSPPTWPQPPHGWRPDPGWRPGFDWPPAPPGWQFWEVVDVPVVTARDIAPDPALVSSLPTPLPRQLDPTYTLDREVASALLTSNWGLGEVGKTLLWLAALLAVATGLDFFAGATTAAAFGEASFGLAVVAGARKAARQSGGWRRALGWRLPRPSDAWLAVRWFGWQSLVRIVAGLLLIVVTMPLGGGHESNVDISVHDPITTLIVEILVTVALAPVVEEFLFRGLLLRALMRRFSFWPAALVDAVIFGVVHAPQVESWAGRIQLAGQVAVFGFMQCLLVRRTGRLGPAMLVHGMLNAMAIGVALS